MPKSLDFLFVYPVIPVLTKKGAQSPLWGGHDNKKEKIFDRKYKKVKEKKRFGSLQSLFYCKMHGLSGKLFATCTTKSKNH